MIDVETTGLDPGRDHIVELAGLVMDDTLSMQVTHRWSRKDGPLPLKRCVDALSAVAKMGTVVAHNLAFDLAFLRAEAGARETELASPRRWLCTMRLTGARTTLASLAQALGLEPIELHTAGGDTRTLAVVLSRLINSAKRRGFATVAGIATVAPVGKGGPLESSVTGDGRCNVRAALDYVVPFPPVTLDQRLAFVEERRHPGSPGATARRLRSAGITALAFDLLLAEFGEPPCDSQPPSRDNDIASRRSP